MDTHLPQFSATFSGDIVTPDHEQYSKSISRWAVNSELKAAVVTFPRSTEDVKLAIKFAQDAGLPLAVRGGGHWDFSSTEGGLVSLSYFPRKAIILT